MAKAKVYKLRPRKTSRLTITRLLLPLIGVSIVFLWITAPTMKLLSERTANKDLRMQYKSSKLQNQELKEEIDKLKTPSYIELRARNDLGLVKAGEIQYYVVLKKAKSKPKVKAKPKSWLENTLDFLEVTFAK